MKLSLILLGAGLVLAPSAALAQAAPAWFICGAKNDTANAVAVTRPFQGDLDFLDSYRGQYAEHLASVGLLAPGAHRDAVACTWADSEAAATAELKRVTTLGPENDPQVKFVTLDWRGRDIGDRTVWEVDTGVQALNRQISERNAAAQAREKAAEARHQAAMAAFEAQQKAYREAVAATEAEAARRKAQYEADRAAWQAQVAACKSGDRSACAKD
ncbi:hypothetical protein ACFODL_19340 [Phenylobacterium terrae]|uniref:Uncharacterized protein n=1 Tax=Phenylobacterium terrae TaxID=2665495 RepID=A0ABW4N4C6_9CAUL